MNGDRLKRKDELGSAKVTAEAKKNDQKKKKDRTDRRKENLSFQPLHQTF